MIRIGATPFYEIWGTPLAEAHVFFLGRVWQCASRFFGTSISTYVCIPALSTCCFWLDDLRYNIYIYTFGVLNAFDWNNELSLFRCSPLTWIDHRFWKAASFESKKRPHGATGFVFFQVTLWWTNILPWKMAIEIVDFPINSMVISHCKMLVHQRVKWFRNLD